MKNRITSEAKLLLIILLTFSFQLLTLDAFTQNVGINATGSLPDNSALLDLNSSEKGLLVPRMTTTQRDAIPSPANSVLIFNTTTECFEAYHVSTSSWVAFGCSGWICGNALAITHTTANGVAPEAKNVNYGTVLTNLTGSDKCWITQNLGASNQADSAADATNASAGWYWQFNRKQGYMVGPTPAWTTSINGTSDWTAEEDPCTIELGAAWRLPTKTEWNSADGNWSNYTDTYASALKLHAAGWLDTSNGSLGGRGTGGYYWSSTQNTAASGWNLYFYSSYSDMYSGSKAYGSSVRCLRD